MRRFVWVVMLVGMLGALEAQELPDLEAIERELEQKAAEQAAAEKAKKAKAEAKRKAEAEAEAKRQAEAAKREAEAEAERQAEAAKREAEAEAERQAEAAKLEAAAAASRMGIVLVDIPAGSFQMGSDSSEAEADEQPVHTVQVAAFRMMKHEVTRGQYQRFVAATGYRTAAEQNAGGESGCYSETATAGEFGYVAGRSFRDPGFEQDDLHPAVCLSWDDAVAFAAWLSRKTGQVFRLPTEAEWEYAARAGDLGERPAPADQICRYGNVADRSTQRQYSAWTIHQCDDGQAHTAPVGTFGANAFGLHDLLGNVWEWTADCWNDSYAGAPSDARAWTTGDCARRVVRGGGWSDKPAALRFGNRNGGPATGRLGGLGFRLVQEL